MQFKECKWSHLPTKLEPDLAIVVGSVEPVVDEKLPFDEDHFGRMEGLSQRRTVRALQMVRCLCRSPCKPPKSRNCWRCRDSLSTRTQRKSCLCSHTNIGRPNWSSVADLRSLVGSNVRLVEARHKRLHTLPWTRNGWRFRRVRHTNIASNGLQSCRRTRQVGIRL